MEGHWLETWIAASILVILVWTLLMQEIYSDKWKIVFTIVCFVLGFPIFLIIAILILCLIIYARYVSHKIEEYEENET